MQNKPDTFICQGTFDQVSDGLTVLMRQTPWPSDSKDAKRMHNTVFAKTYMPYGEEDQRRTEDEGKHVAKGSESEHNWAKRNEYLQTGTRCSAPKWIRWMEPVTGHAARRASSSSSKYLQQCVANLGSGLPRSVCHILERIKKVRRRVVVLLDLQSLSEIKAY